MKPILVHRAARTELDQAMEFYESRRKGLGLDLLTKVENALLVIQRSPESWPKHKQTEFRKCIVGQFPYAVFYMIFPDRIWIVAIAHGSRRPDYWKRRGSL